MSPYRKRGEGRTCGCNDLLSSSERAGRESPNNRSAARLPRPRLSPEIKRRDAGLLFVSRNVTCHGLRDGDGRDTLTKTDLRIYIHFFVCVFIRTCIHTYIYMYMYMQTHPHTCMGAHQTPQRLTRIQSGGIMHTKKLIICIRHELSINENKTDRKIPSLFLNK